MNILNNILDNDILFYGMFAGVVCHMSFFFLSAIQPLKKEMTEKGVQTDALEEFSDRPSQIIQENLSSIETLSPVSPAFEETSAVIPSTSEVGTPTIAEDVNIEVVPNPDIVGRVLDPSNAEYIAAKVDQLNALDPFLATPWTPERVSAMIDSLSLLNDFM
jgi:hypothetical protein